MLSGSLLAQVTHISVNKMVPQLGGAPSLRVNIIAAPETLANLEFEIRQSHTQEQLLVQPLNQFLLQLSGKQAIKDAQARLIVRHQQDGQWRVIHESKVLSSDFGATSQSDVTQSKVGEQNSVITAVPAVTQESAPSQHSNEAKSPTAALLKAAQLPQPRSPQSTARAQGKCRLNFDGKETLWRLGVRYAKSWGMSPYGAIMAIFEANPHAFSNGNINGLKAGVRLICPSMQLRKKFAQGQQARAIFEAL